jgi:hypothetical protein
MNNEPGSQEFIKSRDKTTQPDTARYIPNTDISGPNAWSGDFSYDYYITLLKAAQENFRICLISDAEQLLEMPRKTPVLFLRHDIDVSVEDALKMARIEQGLGVSTTYYVRLNTAFYSLKDSKTRRELLEILRLGHEIGLHYDHTRDTDPESGFNALEEITNVPVRSISFHIPLPEQMQRGGLKICGRINAYAHELKPWYMADSSGRWWDGEPLPRLKKPEGPVLQLVVHPCWWGEKVIPAQKRETIVQRILEGW